MNMARNCRALVRQFLGSSGSNPSAALVHHYHKLSCNSIHTLLLGLTSIPTIPSSPTTIASTSKPFSNFFCAPNLHLLQHRRLVSSPPDRLLVKVIATKDDYDLEAKRIQDQSLPAIFCFTTYSEPLCFYVARILRKMKQQFPHVAICEIALDAKAHNYESTLKDLDISYKPSFCFFKNGKKVNKVGLKRFGTDAEAYIERLKRIVGQLYSIQPTKSSSRRENKRTTQESDVQPSGQDENVSGRARIELFVSKEEYNLAVSRIQDESLPAILCFATYSEHYSKWVSEFLENELSERFSLVPIYYFILDPKEDDYETTLKSLNISSTPTFHFFKNGKKVDELASERFEFYQYAADLEKILENLYNTQISSFGTGSRNTQELDSQPMKDKDS